MHALNLRLTSKPKRQIQTGSGMLAARLLPLFIVISLGCGLQAICQATSPPFLPLSGGNISYIPNPAAPTLTVNGTPGSTAYSYACTATSENGETTGSSQQIANGPANLSSTNSITVQCPFPFATGTQAENVYRTAGPGGTGLIGQVNSSGVFTDTGGSATTSLPLINTTGAVNAAIFNSTVYNVLQFGAKGDGVTNDTAAINAAMSACYNGGGGTVLIPPTPRGYVISRQSGTTAFYPPAILLLPGCSLQGHDTKLILQSSSGQSGDTVFIGTNLYPSQNYPGPAYTQTLIANGSSIKKGSNKLTLSSLMFETSPPPPASPSLVNMAVGDDIWFGYGVVPGQYQPGEDVANFGFAKIASIDTATNTITLDTPMPADQVVASTGCLVPYVPVASANITSFSINNNVITFQAANRFAAGEYVNVSGFSNSYLNNQVLQILPTGLTPTQFEASFTHASVSSTTDTGQANLVYSGITSWSITAGSPSNIATFTAGNDFRPGQIVFVAGTGTGGPNGYLTVLPGGLSPTSFQAYTTAAVGSGEGGTAAATDTEVTNVAISGTTVTLTLTKNTFQKGETVQMSGFTSSVGAQLNGLALIVSSATSTSVVLQGPSGLTAGSAADSGVVTGAYYNCYITDLGQGNQTTTVSGPSMIYQNATIDGFDLYTDTVTPIVKWSLTSNVVTFTTAPNLTNGHVFNAGETVKINGLGVGSFMNGKSFTVLSTGLTPTQFQINYTHPDVATTYEAGTASGTGLSETGVMLRLARNVVVSNIRCHEAGVSCVLENYSDNISNHNIRIESSNAISPGFGECVHIAESRNISFDNFWCENFASNAVTLEDPNVNISFDNTHIVVDNTQPTAGQAIFQAGGLGQEGPPTEIINGVAGNLTGTFYAKATYQFPQPPGTPPLGETAASGEKTIILPGASMTGTITYTTITSSQAIFTLSGTVNPFAVNDYIIIPSGTTYAACIAGYGLPVVAINQPNNGSTASPTITVSLPSPNNCTAVSGADSGTIIGAGGFTVSVPVQPYGYSTATTWNLYLGCSASTNCMTGGTAGKGAGSERFYSSEPIGSVASFTTMPTVNVAGAAAPAQGYNSFVGQAGPVNFRNVDVTGCQVVSNITGCAQATINLNSYYISSGQIYFNTSSSPSFQVGATITIAGISNSSTDAYLNGQSFVVNSNNASENIIIAPTSLGNIGSQASPIALSCLTSCTATAAPTKNFAGDNGYGSMWNFENLTLSPSYPTTLTVSGKILRSVTGHLTDTTDPSIAGDHFNYRSYWGTCYITSSSSSGTCAIPSGITRRLLIYPPSGTHNLTGFSYQSGNGAYSLSMLGNLSDGMPYEAVGPELQLGVANVPNYASQSGKYISWQNAGNVGPLTIPYYVEYWPINGEDFSDAAVQTPSSLSGLSAAWSNGGNSIAANSCVNGPLVTMNGTLGINMAITVTPSANQGSGLLYLGYYSTPTQVQTVVCNITTSGITPASHSLNVRASY